MKRRKFSFHFEFVLWLGNAWPFLVSDRFLTSDFSHRVFFWNDSVLREYLYLKAALRIFLPRDAFCPLCSVPIRHMSVDMVERATFAHVHLHCQCYSSKDNRIAASLPLRFEDYKILRAHSL